MELFQVYTLQWVGKTGHEFFTGSQDGTVRWPHMKRFGGVSYIFRWWDIRKFGKATREWLVARDETETDPDKAEGVCSLSFEPTMSSKFMVGTAQGNVLSCRMQAKPGTSGWILMLLILILILYS